KQKKQKILKEVKSLAKLDSEYVVKYYHSWLESNHLFIQMEFCSQSLKSFINDKPIVFERQPEDHMNSVFEYFISCEIFKELLECVQYLHSCDPPVIHRDLKPDNILITNKFRSNRCVKLCDFGLATEHDPQLHTASRYEHSFVGTFRYIAPEVYTRRKYNYKSDIFSLSLIGEEIFSLDLQPSTSFSAQESLFNSSTICLYKTLQSMTNYEFRQRPECWEVLAKHNEWSIDKNFVVKYYNSWSEEKHVFIHMEYCCQTLGDVIKDKAIVFGRQLPEAMNLYEYFISCEILREHLQCLQYIHKLNPPVIHRDLKPANILIVNNNNNRFVKLGDFVVATDHGMTSMSHTLNIGSLQYMAPEVFQSRYNTKVDIYSLAVISQHLFNLFNIEKPQETYSLTTFSANFHKLYQIIKQMSLGLADDRPTSG
ncbi:unnamed protein product, partial [Medioppia subpectinata]